MEINILSYRLFKSTMNWEGQRDFEAKKRGVKGMLFWEILFE